MDDRYNSSKVEEKWQKIWEEKGIYETNLNDAEKPKYYALVMFPYPSGDKLHIGHWYNFAPADSYARYMRMKGFNVLEPMGFDAFGLPAENFAIKTGIHPTISIKKNCEFMIQQLKRMGCMYDWSKMVNTSTPDYYKWTQWIFLQMYKHGLAFRKNAPVNWCPSCQTVLANEQVQEGTCDRCDAEVTKKNLTQWFWKMSAYAKQLLDGHESLQGGWPERTIQMQQNWIGRSEGSEIDFEIVPDPENEIRKTGEVITAFSTRIDTLFGCTYLILAPEHPLVSRITTKKYKKNVEEYIEATCKKRDIDRTAADLEKTGVFTGAYLVNPINNEKIPVWIGDYVLASYGTGAVFMSPAHDQRDFLFAKKYDLPIRWVIEPRNGGKSKQDEAFTEYGILMNSGKFSGMTSEEAKLAITKELIKKKRAKFVVQYCLRDWLISRQRYWGCPIPMVYCEKCGEVPVPEKDLPVLLPEEVDFKPRGDGKSPLATSPNFVRTKCPKCKGEATRETDTMDTFVDSSFYFLRYLDNTDEKQIADKARIKKWMPVDMYIGGPEHACMHLIYARFMMMALKDFGVLGEQKLGSRGSRAEANKGRGASVERSETELVGENLVSHSLSEPFARLVHQGLITHKGAKMSKSKGNVVSPDEFVEKFGSDVFRMYLMFMGPFEAGGDWNDRGIIGIVRFMDRLWTIFHAPHAIDEKLEVKQALHRTIKKATEDIAIFHFNTCLSAFMELSNLALHEGISLESKRILAQLLGPLAPHFAEEVWESIGGKFSIFDSVWPQAEKKYLESKTMMIVCQVNGKFRGSFSCDLSATKEEVVMLAKKDPRIVKFLEGKKIDREIYVSGRLINFVVKD